MEDPDVDAADGGGHQAHGAQLGEAAAHAIGHDEGGQILLLGDLDKISLCLVRGGNEVAGDVLAHSLLQQIHRDQQLGHGLRGAAGLGDDVEHGLL